MELKGSITVFFTLLLSVMISFICSLLLSAKISAGRVQAANAADQVMFSAMAKYDRALFEEYHLLYIDGGFGTDTLQLGKALDEIQSDLSYLLTPNKGKEWAGGKNFLQLEMVSGSISGYTLATDCNGSVFWEQAVSYMEDTLGLQGISLLSQKLSSEQKTIQSQMDSYESVEEKGDIQDYENIKEEAYRQESEGNPSDPSDAEPSPNGGRVNRKQKQKEDSSLAKQTRETLDAASVLKQTSLLNLVLSDTESVSEWSAQWDDLYRNRDTQTGMGYLELVREEHPLTDDLLFQEYILQNLNHYGTEIHSTGPAYGVEWVLYGKNSDVENLEATINRLILIREAANAAALYSDGSRRAEVQTLAAALAAGFGLPYVQPVLEGVIILLWAFAESVVDVRGLLEGGEVPLVKNASCWQVEFSEILTAIQNPGDFFSDRSGISYEGYLRVLLAAKSREEKIERCIEVIEQSMRQMPGKEQFSMGCAIDSLETEFEVRIQDYVICTIAEKRSYRTM